MMAIILRLLDTGKLQKSVSEFHLMQTVWFFFEYAAKMYYQLFPKLLNSEKSQFEVGVSSKIYTAETADAYINSLIEEQLKSSAVHISDKAEATNCKSAIFFPNPIIFDGVVFSSFQREQISKTLRF